MTFGRKTRVFSRLVIDQLKKMGLLPVFNADKLQFRVWFPVQSNIKVTGKDLPLRSIIKLVNVTFGMRFDFHAWQRGEALGGSVALSPSPKSPPANGLERKHGLRVSSKDGTTYG